MDPARVRTPSFGHGAGGSPHQPQQQQQLGQAAAAAAACLYGQDPAFMPYQSATSPGSASYDSGAGVADYSPSLQTNLAGHLEFNNDLQASLQQHQLYQKQHQQQSQQQDFRLFSDPPMFGGGGLPNLGPGAGPAVMFDPAQQQIPAAGINPADLSRSASYSPVYNATLGLPDTTHHSSPSAAAGGPSSTRSSPSPFSYYSPDHSRQTSLDPSAAYGISGMGSMGTGGGADWNGLLGNPAFQSHRRAPSEHSDVSSAVSHSPYLQQQDWFDAEEHATPSPLLAAAHDPAVAAAASGSGPLPFESLPIDSINISETRISPAHSPFISPSLQPQAPGDLSGVGDLGGDLGGGLGTAPVLEPGPTITTIHAPPEGGASQGAQPMPSINVELVPAAPAPQPNFDLKPGINFDTDTLSPPMNSRFSWICKNAC